MLKSKRNQLINIFKTEQMLEFRDVLQISASNHVLTILDMIENVTPNESFIFREKFHLNYLKFSTKKYSRLLI